MITNIVFAGVRGGVGTTTLTALAAAVFHQAGAVVSLADHSEGRLDSRLASPPGSLGITLQAMQLGFAPAHQRSISVSLLDAGLLHQPVVRYLRSPTTGLVLVGSPDPESTAAIATALELIDAEVGPGSRGRCRPCIVDVRQQYRRTLVPWKKPGPMRAPHTLMLPFQVELQPWGPVPVESLAQKRAAVLPKTAELLDSVLTSRVGVGSPESPSVAEEPDESGSSTGTLWLSDVPTGQGRY